MPGDGFTQRTQRVKIAMRGSRERERERVCRCVFPWSHSTGGCRGSGVWGGLQEHITHPDTQHQIRASFYSSGLHRHSAAPRPDAGSSPANYTTLHSHTTLNYPTIPYTTLTHYTTIHYTHTLHYSTIHYTTLQHTTLHHTALTHTSSDIASQYRRHCATQCSDYVHFTQS